MSEGTSTRRCTVERPDRTFCDAESFPGAPFPICEKHAMSVFTHLRDLVAEVPELAARERSIMVRAFRDIPVVYYLRVDGWIKIGHTINLAQRLRSYPPSAVLLGVESGAPSLEQRRHRQFRRFLAQGREWFAPAAPLLDHIGGLSYEKLAAKAG